MLTFAWNALFQMNSYIIIVILFITMGLFIWGRWRYDIVALIALATTTLCGAVPLKQLYIGLSNPAVITVACIMVISETISNTGVLNRLIHHLSSTTAKPWMHVSILCVITALLSAFMNNVGALALMMPIAIKTSLQHKRSPSFILMPIATASALGGLMTMIGTPPNLLISAYRQDITGHAYRLFDFFPVGSVVALVGVIFIGLIGFRLMPKRRKSSNKMTELFDIDDYTFEIKVSDKSVICQMGIADIYKLVKVDFDIVSVLRHKNKRVALSSDFVIDENDILIIQASADDIKDILRTTKTELASDRQLTKDLDTPEVEIFEAVIPQGSRLEGRNVKSFRLNARYQMNLLAIARENHTFKDRLSDVTLKSGDVVLLRGPSQSIAESTMTLGLLPLIERNLSISISWRSWLPLLIFMVAIVCVALNLLPIEAALGGTVLSYVVFKLIPAKLLYDGIDWSIIILLAAMIPIGAALQTTGGTALIASLLTHSTSLFSPSIILIIMMIITMTVSDFMNNAATAIVMAPIAATLATTLKVNIDPFLMGVAVASSCSFLTPVGHQNNTLVMGPGGYKFTDYIRLGLPVEILVLAASVPMILWRWPLYH